MRATPARVYVRATAAPGRQDDRSLTRGACWSDRQAGPLLPAATGAACSLSTQAIIAKPAPGARWLTTLIIC